MNIFISGHKCANTKFTTRFDKCHIFGNRRGKKSAGGGYGHNGFIFFARIYPANKNGRRFWRILFFYIYDRAIFETSSNSNDNNNASDTLAHNLSRCMNHSDNKHASYHEINILIYRLCIIARLEDERYRGGRGGGERFVEFWKMTWKFRFCFWLFFLYTPIPTYNDGKKIDLFESRRSHHFK